MQIISTTTINKQKIDFNITDDKVFTTSLDIAKVFEKRHTHILDIIKGFQNNIEMKKFNQPNFRLVSYKDAKGEMRPYYNISRDGFALLAMGFTGEKGIGK